MIKKYEIISVLIDYGMSIIESDSATDDKENFRLAIEDIVEKARWEGKNE